MNARDELAKVIEGGYGDDHTDCPYDHAPAIADVILAAGYRKPRTITTAEELDAASPGTVIRDRDPLTCTKWASGLWGTFSGDAVSSNRINLPATVLHEGAA